MEKDIMSSTVIRRSAAGFAVALAIAALASTPPSRAEALSDPPSPRPSVSVGGGDHQQFVANAEKYGVSDDAAERLYAKWKSGATLDAYTPGASPVSTDQSVIDGRNYSIERYADASFQASSIGPAPTPRGTVHPNAALGCTSDAGAGAFEYYNCTVAFSGPIYGGQFTADFYSSFFTAAEHPSVIRAVRNPQLSVVAGTFSNLKLEITVPTATDRVASEARLSAIYKATGDVAGGTASIRLVNPQGSAPTVESP